MVAKIRLFLDQPLCPGQPVLITRDQAHYLFGVMRKDVGAAILVFNARDGEWLAEVAEAGKRRGTLIPREQTRAVQMPPDLWLLFAPIKKARTDFIVEKAAEMGAARIVPVQTDFTNSERIRQARLQSHAIEAVEQCGGIFVPEVAALQKLDRLLDAWPPERKIMFCDEAQFGQGKTLIANPAPDPWAILIGPEGGFSPSERDRLNGLPFARPVSLGPRILRADTAVVAAMTLWQKTLGDWR